MLCSVMLMVTVLTALVDAETVDDPVQDMTLLPGGIDRPHFVINCTDVSRTGVEARCYGSCEGGYHSSQRDEVPAREVAIFVPNFDVSPLVWKEELAPGQKPMDCVPDNWIVMITGFVTDNWIPIAVAVVLILLISTIWAVSGGDQTSGEGYTNSGDEGYTNSGDRPIQGSSAGGKIGTRTYLNDDAGRGFGAGGYSYPLPTKSRRVAKSY